jgi:hypothetical protein
VVVELRTAWPLCWTINVALLKSTLATDAVKVVRLSVKAGPTT